MIKIKKMLKMTTRFISLLMALAMLAVLPAGSFADTQELFPEEEPGAHTGDYLDEKGEVKLTRDVPRSVDEDFSFTRVLLGTNSASSLTVGLYGAYYIENNMRSMVGNADSPYTLGVSVSGNKVRLSHGGSTLITAESVTINRVNLNESAGYLTIGGCSGGYADGKSYLGNLRISVGSDGKLCVINVIPTAHYLYGLVPYEMSESCEPAALRAQAIACKSYAFAFPSNSDAYDITDSVNYQGYRGYTPGHDKCMQACTDVCGQILSFNSNIELTFYGSTNGGETDNPKNVFGSSQLESAYEVKLDDIDFEFAVSKRQTLEIRFGERPANEAFVSLLESEAASYLGHAVELISVDGAEAVTPKFEGSRRNMTKLHVILTVLDPTLGGEYTTLSFEFDITKLKTPGIFNKAYKIYWSAPTDGGCEVYFCRHGHGLGLSQYGAQGRALAGCTHEEILEFYFSLFDLSDVVEANPERPLAYTQNVLAYGVVTGNSVNFRTGPSTDYSVITVLTRNRHLDVVGVENGWLRCIADGKLGYISGKYVDIPLFPSPVNGVFTYHSAVITSACSAYDVPGTLGTVTADFAAGDRVTVRHIIGSYYYITSDDGRLGFVSSDLVEIRHYSVPSPLTDELNENRMRINP